MRGELALVNPRSWAGGAIAGEFEHGTFSPVIVGVEVLAWTFRAHPSGGRRHRGVLRGFAILAAGHLPVLPAPSEWSAPAGARGRRSRRSPTRYMIRVGHRLVFGPHRGRVDTLAGLGSASPLRRGPDDLDRRLLVVHPRLRLALDGAARRSGHGLDADSRRPGESLASPAGSVPRCSGSLLATALAAPALLSMQFPRVRADHGAVRACGFPGLGTTVGSFPSMRSPRSSGRRGLRSGPRGTSSRSHARESSFANGAVPLLVLLAAWRACGRSRPAADKAAPFLVLSCWSPSPVLARLPFGGAASATASGGFPLFHMGAGLAAAGCDPALDAARDALAPAPLHRRLLANAGVLGILLTLPLAWNTWSLGLWRTGAGAFTLVSCGLFGLLALGVEVGTPGFPPRLACRASRRSGSSRRSRSHRRATSPSGSPWRSSGPPIRSTSGAPTSSSVATSSLNGRREMCRIGNTPLLSDLHVRQRVHAVRTDRDRPGVSLSTVHGSNRTSRGSPQQAARNSRDVLDRPGDRRARRCRGRGGWSRPSPRCRPTAGGARSSSRIASSATAAATSGAPRLERPPRAGRQALRGRRSGSRERRHALGRRGRAPSPPPRRSRSRRT